MVTLSKALPTRTAFALTEASAPPAGRTLAVAAAPQALPAELWRFVQARRLHWLLPVLLPILLVGGLIRLTQAWRGFAAR